MGVQHAMAVTASASSAAVNDVQTVGKGSNDDDMGAEPSKDGPMHGQVDAHDEELQQKEAQLQQQAMTLQDMGLGNADVLLEMLRANGGSVGKVVEDLVGGR